LKTPLRPVALQVILGSQQTSAAGSHFSPTALQVTGGSSGHGQSIRPPQLSERPVPHVPTVVQSRGVQHGGQSSVPPQPSSTVPQSVSTQAVFGVQHGGQSRVPPQPSSTVPQSVSRQMSFGLQHSPQSRVLPQPSSCLPQPSWSQVAGVHSEDSLVVAANPEIPGGQLPQ